MNSLNYKRDTTCKEKKNWIGIFYDKPGKQNQEKN